MKVVSLTFLLMSLPLYPQTPSALPKARSSSDRKQSRLLKYEIEDLIPAKKRFIQNGSGSESTDLDAWALLPDSPLLLPLPKGIHVIEQIKRIIVWEYKLSNDREMYKAEYQALLGDPKKWVDYISDNLEMLLSNFKSMMWDAAHSGDAEKVNTLRNLRHIVMGSIMNEVYWETSVNPKLAADLIKKNKEEALVRTQE